MTYLRNRYKIGDGWVGTRVVFGDELFFNVAREQFRKQADFEAIAREDEYYRLEAIRCDEYDRLTDWTAVATEALSWVLLAAYALVEAWVIVKIAIRVG